MDEMGDNVFVLGADPHNRAVLDELAERRGYRIHGLLEMEELRDAHDRLPELLDDARRILDGFEGSVDAVIGFWDFPVRTLVPILCAERGLHSPSLESVVKCEHKYWSRREQREVTDAVPPFAEVPLEAEAPPPEVGYPMWLKPVKSFSSALAFRVTDDEEFREALGRIREGIDDLGSPFDWLLRRIDLPEAVARAGGSACLAEEEVHGEQVTVEGYVWRGDPVVYGVVSSATYPDSPSFLRYTYPSGLPGTVAERLADISERVVRRMGLDATTFNIEYFWNPGDDTLRLLEINPRHSQSHARLMAEVDGVPNHDHMVRLALGREPLLETGAGRHATAAKWFLRRFTDGVVRTAPGPEDIARMERDVPGTGAKVSAPPGTRLSRMPSQDSYSYELAQVFTAGRSDEDLRRAYELCLARLPFEIDEPDEDAAAGGEGG
ncbi:ATP-grasp domain-containing protein [Nocardiopsis baichengensis]|uniref:ATP-grasp domain-containing protein n=1 Tax=Nocardiopsis baichengensis TaxID=280240 RepID=UPI000344FF49|nr:ATP-grasp domain-containing protein [Nocardiopsis baichengensis]